jgi:hypothetical protein
VTLSTLAHRIDWDRFPTTHQHLGSIPTQRPVMCRACGDDIAPGESSHAYTERPAGAPVVLMCDTCHAEHAGGAR